MRKKLPLLIIIVAAAIVYFGFFKNVGNNDVRSFYGTVELNYIDLAFIDSEKVLETYADEGDRIKKGDMLAKLDTERLAFRIAQAEAEKNALGSQLDKMKHGYDKEDLAKADAAVKLTKAQMDLAKIDYERQMKVQTSGGVSQSEIDRRKTALTVAEETYIKSLNDYQQIKKGYRVEDIAQAESKFAAAEAALGLLKKQANDAVLVSPSDGFISSKNISAGEIAVPQKSVYQLIIDNPVRLRGYISEPLLGVVKIGDPVTVFTDSGSTVTGKITFISQKAEFTPKTVQTEELRTSLVYMVKITVDNSDDGYLKQGMPVTVKF